MARLTDQVEQMEAELEHLLEEVSNKSDMIDSLEDTCNSQSATINDLEQRVGDLEEFEAFIREHFPQAGQAYDVRERMEKANGNSASVG